MPEIKMDWVQTARANAVEMDKARMTCMPEEAALLRGLADEIERLQTALKLVMTSFSHNAAIHISRMALGSLSQYSIHRGEKP